MLAATAELYPKLAALRLFEKRVLDGRAMYLPAVLHVFNAHSFHLE